MAQKTKGVQADGCALDRRLDQNGFGSGHVRGCFPLSTSCRQGSWFFRATDVHRKFG